MYGNLDTLVGFDFFGFMGKMIGGGAKAPRTKAEILELLKTEGESTPARWKGFPRNFWRRR